MHRLDCRTHLQATIERRRSEISPNSMSIDMPPDMQLKLLATNGPSQEIFGPLARSTGASNSGRSQLSLNIS